MDRNRIYPNSSFVKILEGFKAQLPRFVEELELFWNELGMPENGRQTQLEEVNAQFSNLLKVMTEENKHREMKLTETVSNMMKTISALGKELDVCVKHHYEDKGEGLLLIEQSYKNVIEELQNQKQVALNEVRELLVHEKVLAEKLDLKLMGVSEHHIPSKNTKSELKNHIEMLKQEKSNREAQFRALVFDLASLNEQLEQQNNSTFEEKVLFTDAEEMILSEIMLKNFKTLVEEKEKSLLERKNLANDLRMKIQGIVNNLPASEMVDQEELKQFLSNNAGHSLKHLNNLEQRLESVLEIRKKHIKDYIVKLKNEIEELWDACFIDWREREVAGPGIESESYLEKLEAERDAMRKYFSDNELLIKSANGWFAAFEKYIESEKKPTDLNSRGGRLMKELQEKRKLEANLAKYEKEMVDLNAEYERTHQKPFMHFHCSLMDAVSQKKSEYDDEKENEKLRRKEDKRNRLLLEANLGAKTTAMKNRTEHHVPLVRSPKNTATTLIRTPFSSTKKAAPLSTQRSSSRSAQRMLHMGVPMVKITEDSDSTTYTDFMGAISRSKNKFPLNSTTAKSISKSKKQRLGTRRSSRLKIKTLSQSPTKSRRQPNSYSRRQILSKGLKATTPFYV